MDTSKEYIKMCKKAKEIQKKWKPRVGDLLNMPHLCKYLFGKLQSVSTFKECSWVLRPDQIEEIEREELLRNNCVWLPRQDQLQEMIGDFSEQKKNMQFLFTAHWLHTERQKEKVEHSFYWAKLKGWEQLWLGLVMIIKYNKTWNGKDWK